jgi:hypothetical protein
MSKRATKKNEPRPSPGVRGFSFAEVVSATSATRSNLIHWTNTGIVRPDIADTAGPGHARRFSIVNVVEAEIGATLNRFGKVRAKLIGDAINRFRHFHQLSVALYRASSAPIGDPGNAFSPEQATAAASVFAEAMLRRDLLAGKAKHSRAFYEKAVRPQLNDSTEQQKMLAQAFKWRMFCHTIEQRDQQFFGLFVCPDEQDSTIVDDPIVLNDVMKDIAFVVNLGRVLNRVDDGLGMFAAIDDAFT